MGNQLWAGRGREEALNSLWWPGVPLLRTSALGLSPDPASPPRQAWAQGSLWANAPWVVPGARQASPAVCSVSSLATEEVAGPGTHSPKTGSLAFPSPEAPSTAAPACSWNGRH